MLTNWSLPFVTSQSRVDFSNSLWSIRGESRMNGRTVLSSWETCVLCLGITGEGSFVPTSRTLSGTTRSPFILSKLVQFSSIKTRLLARLYSLFFVGPRCCRRTLRVEARHWVGAAGTLVRYRSSARLRKVLPFQKNLPTISSPT